jgi:hypothetical protein
VPHLLLMMMEVALQPHLKQLEQQLHLQPLCRPSPLLLLLLQLHPRAAAAARLLPLLPAALLPPWLFQQHLLRLLLLGVRAALPAASAGAAWRCPQACQQPAAEQTNKR